MKNLIVIILFLETYSININAQIIERKVLSNFGHTYSNNGYILQETVSQTAVKTLISSGNILTQGFQQSEITIVKTNDLSPDFEFTLFPNPTTNLLNFKIKNEQIEDLKIYLSSNNSQQISVTDVISKEGNIDLSYLPDGNYIVSIFKKNTLLKSFQVIKLTK
ncbi:MAG: T9SS type A sorting domain-containing protein [Saprospiraceae bacterium]